MMSIDHARRIYIYLVEYNNGSIVPYLYYAVLYEEAYNYYLAIRKILSSKDNQIKQIHLLPLKETEDIWEDLTRIP